MNCPVDGTELRITDREGIEIDYCPQCRGIWLDRGELDKVLERSARTVTVGERGRERSRDDDRPYRERDDRGYDRDDDRDYDRGYGKKGRRRSILEDLLDFD
jgi:Zn-finger nucleic acid-binding protein